MKQGINSRQTGNLLSRAGNLQRLAGNCLPCAGIRAEAQSDARPAPHGPRVDQSVHSRTRSQHGSILPGAQVRSTRTSG